MSKPNFNCDIYCLPFYSGEDGLGINPTESELEKVILNYHDHLIKQDRTCCKIGYPVQWQNTTWEQLLKNLTASFKHKVEWFVFVELAPHQKIRNLITNLNLIPEKEIHIIPDIDLNYGRFKDEIWDLHVEGYGIFIHRIDRSKNFKLNQAKLEKLTSKGAHLSISLNSTCPLRNRTVRIGKSLFDEGVIEFIETSDLHNHLYNSTMKNQINLRKKFELTV